MPAATQEIDVIKLPPRERHSTIFATFNKLAPRESLRLIVDHDPAPLRYQLAAEHPNGYEWSYEQSGPDIWKVVIVKK